MLFDQVREDLQEKIRRLEEDRHNIDITSGNGYLNCGLHKMTPQEHRKVFHRRSREGEDWILLPLLLSINLPSRCLEEYLGMQTAKQPFSDLWHESQNQRKNRRKGASSGGLFSPDRRRKPVSVSGPYIVYMLKDMDIIEDWTAIKKVCFCSSLCTRDVLASHWSECSWEKNARIATNAV